MLQQGSHIWSSASAHVMDFVAEGENQKTWPD